MSKKIPLILILFVSIATLTELGIFVGKLPTLKTSKPSNSVTTVKPTPLANQTEDKSKGIWRDITKAKLSPNGHYLAYFAHYTREGVETIELYIVEQSNEYFVKRKTLSTTWSLEKNSDTSGYQFISWSPDGKYLAAVAGKNFIVVTFDLLGTDQYHKEVIVQKDEFEGQLGNHPTGELGVWFDGNTLRASMSDGVHEIWPKSVKLIGIDKQEGIYPTRGGYLYWRQAEDCCNVNLYQITADGKTTADTGISIVDYFGVVLANQTGERLCVENGSSGYWGYLLYDLTNRKKVASGQQYSYCGRWLDADRVSLIEIPYFDQWSRQVYIYDWTTNTKEAIVNTNNSQINPFNFYQP